MILKPGMFYQTQQNHNLLASDRAGQDTRHGGKVMGIVNMNDLVFVIKQARYRYVQVIYRDMVGYIWLPTNLATNQVFIPVDQNEEGMFKPQRGPFVKPTRPAKR